MKPEDEIPVAVATTQEQWRRQRIAKDQVQVAQAGENLGWPVVGCPERGKGWKPGQRFPFKKSSG